jgi:hypothetical protein
MVGFGQPSFFVATIRPYIAAIISRSFNISEL